MTAALRNLAVLFAASLLASCAGASPVENMVPAYRGDVAPATTPDSQVFNVPTPTPGSNCTTTLFVGGKFGPLNQATCTFYDSYTTTTEYVDCKGCALETVGLGPGPVVKCGTNVHKPLGTETVTTCKEPNVAPATPTPDVKSDESKDKDCEKSKGN